MLHGDGAHIESQNRPHIEQPVCLLLMKLHRIINIRAKNHFQIGNAYMTIRMTFMAIARAAETAKL